MKIFQNFYLKIWNFAFKIMTFQFCIFLVSLYHCMALKTQNNASLEKRFTLPGSLSSFQ